MIKMNLNKNSVKTKTKAALMCSTTTSKRKQESQRSRRKSCKLQSTNSKKGKSPDTNGIRAEDIKACDDEAREVVRQFFNEIIKRNEFTPEDWKKVTIKVIHKKGDVENVSNYRPILLIACVLQIVLGDFARKIIPSARPGTSGRSGLASEKFTKQRIIL